MVSTVMLFLYCLLPFLFYSVHFVYPQAIYDDESTFQGTFTKTLKSSVCTENVQNCEKRLHQSQILQENMSKELSEYKSKLMELKVVHTGFLSWAVQDLCRNIKHFVFEDMELCPFYYNFSQNNSYLQRCPAPEMFSDISMTCQDPSTVICGSRAIPDGYMCDFEALDEPNCFLENSKSDTFDWTRKNGSTSSTNTGPSSAYHGKFYTYIETSSPRKLGDNAILESNKIFQERWYCLYLFYHMHGSNIGNLTIKTKESSKKPVVLKQLSGEQGMKWKKMNSFDILLKKDTKNDMEITNSIQYQSP